MITDLDKMRDELKYEGQVSMARFEFAARQCVEDAYECGAAAAFGLIGMAEVLATNIYIEACPRCFKSPLAWCGETVFPYRRQCRDCYEKHGQFPPFDDGSALPGAGDPK